MPAVQKGWGDILEDPVPGDVLKCLEELGVEVIRVEGDEVTGKCPGHLSRVGKEDRHPSWSVNLDSGQHNCFSCGFRGPFVTLVQEVTNFSPQEAVAWIRARGSIDRARRLLMGGITSISLQEEEEEQITEADLALYVEVPEFACEDRWLEPDSADFYGVLWDDKKDRWITPIRDPDTGKLWGWQEKGHEDRYFRNFPKDVKKSKTFFGIHQVEGDEVVLVESPLDVVRLHSAGIKNGVSSFGARVSNTQLALLREFGIHRIISALDNDRDGNKANDDLRRRGKGFRLRYFNYGDLDAKDPGDMTDVEIQEAYATAYSSVLWKRDDA